MNDAITAGTGDDLIHGQLGDDSYHFGRGDGRDVLLDGAVPFQDIAQQARYWRGRRDWYGGGEMEYRAVVASDDDNGSPTSDPDSQPSIALGPDDGGYDRVVFDSDLYVQDVSFVDYNGGDGLYVGYGNLVASTEDNNDSTAYSRGNATDFSFTVGDSPVEKHQLVYADDIVLPEQYQIGHAIEEFVLNDGSRIRNADIYTGLQKSRDYIDLNRSFLEQIQQNGRDAKGYVDQIMLTKWQRQNQDIAGSETDELLFSGDGDDTVVAAGGDDTIVSGFGTDTLHGGSGDDTYIYNRWDGADTIIDATGYDHLVLGNDLLLTDLVGKIDVDSGDLTLGIVNDVDRLRAAENGTDYTPDPESLEQKIVVTDFHSLNGRLELFSFSDGTSMSAMELYNHFFTSEQDDLILGLEGDNVIVAKGGYDSILLGDGNHDIDAGIGDDTVTTGGGDDVINTGGGADIVHAGAGNDTIISSGDGNQLSGAEGDDRLNGGNGDDQFIFGLGDGNDTIYDQGGLDTLVIDDIQGDITPDNLWVERIGNDVVVELEDGSSTFIKDWGLVENRVENIRFGTVNSAIDDLLFLRARNYDLSLNEDTAISGVIELGNAGDDVVFSVEQGGDNDNFTVELDGSWSYAPNQDANGLEQVVVKVTNDQGEVAFSTLNLSVNPVNDLPIVENSNPFMLQDVRALAGKVIASDVDGDLLSYAVCSDPAYGALTLNADGSWNYQAAAGFIGDDQATISVDDGHGGFVATTLNFEVLVSAPAVSNYELSLDEDGSLISQLDVTNPVGGTLTYIVDNNSNHGNFTIAADGRFSYTPTADYHGGDEVQLTVTNDYGLSATSTISLNILPINDLPETVAEESRVLQDIRVVTGTIEASDIDGDILSYAVSGAAEHGSFSIDQEGNWSYEAAELFIGSDQVVVTIEDGNGGRVTSTLDFSVLVSSPEVNNVDDALEEDGSANGMLAVTNPIGGSLVYSVANSGEYGSFDLDDQGNWQYRPDENYHGSDLITVIVTNEYGLTATATIDLAITPVNDAPTVAESTPYQVLGIASVTGQVDANDVDGDLLSYQITSNSEHGTFVIDETGSWSYTPVGGFVGTDSVTFAIHDGNGGQVSSSLSFIGNIYTDGDLVIDGSGPDVLKLDGISKDDLQLNRNAEDLSVVVRDRGTITLVGYYSTPENGVEYLETIEGPLHLAKDLIINVEPSWCSWLFGGSEEGMDGEKNLLYGTDSGETIYGANINDVIFGDSGNDRLYGNNGDDTLVGGSGCDTLRGGLGDDTLYGDSHADNLLGNSGNDALVGGDGNDCLQGGTGNDWLWGDDGCDTLYGEEGADSISGSLGDDLLYGGGGNDLYLFNRNDGYDHLYDNLYSGFMNFCHEDAGQDTVRFGADIGKEDVAVYMSCGNLYLSYGDNDVVKINDQSSDKDKIERFELADGSYLTDSDINQLIQEISSFAVNEGICINSVNDVRQNDALMTLVVESWHQ
jgi:VCBS repeat-containing protein